MQQEEKTSTASKRKPKAASKAPTAKVRRKTNTPPATSFENTFDGKITQVVLKRNAANQFETAMNEIDKSISHLNKIKEALRLTSTHLNRANDKAEDLTIKKLTFNNPTMKEKFNTLKKINV